ncbi:hypothetical protein INT47_006291 [Mucor saturninus]|uniref:Uncharacterized protein n=1 Tax=Mucor saturninus TaxID=64648 RepID=A0A8H7RHN4_9FUNG|nr:hypothetical protein INT47_006291 [Mucor saturninus]
MSMVKDLIKHETQFRASVANSSEASFTEKYLMPAIRRVLLEKSSKNILYALIDKPNQIVKRPETTSRYQPETDYAKLMKQLKGSVDEQLYLGVQNPSSLGLLVEGFDCTLFQMFLLADGVYIPMAINRFSLVEQNHYFLQFPSIVEAFYFVKCELNKFVVRVNEKKTSEEKKIGRECVRFFFETRLEAKNKKSRKANKSQ